MFRRSLVQILVLTTANLTEVAVAALIPFRIKLEQNLKTGHNHFLSNVSNTIIHLTLNREFPPCLSTCNEDTQGWGEVKLHAFETLELRAQLHTPIALPLGKQTNEPQSQCGHDDKESNPGSAAHTQSTECTILTDTQLTKH
jgi:hypothetical protein